MVAVSSTNSDEFYTPCWVTDPLGEFDLDPCAGPLSSIARINWRDVDALAADWHGRVWLNGPYSDDYKRLFLLKAAEYHAATGNGVIGLYPNVPARAWFKECAKLATAVYPMDRRIDFLRADGKKGRGTVDSALFAFGESEAEIIRKSGLVTMKYTFI